MIGAFPLGGYVKMLDEREGQVPTEELHRAFNRQNVWKRIAIVAAGPLANFLLAITLYWGLYGGGVEEIRPRVGTPVAGSQADRAGFQDGELVRAVSGEQVQTWQEFRWKLLNRALTPEEVHRTAFAAVSEICAFDFAALTHYDEPARRHTVVAAGLPPGTPRCCRTGLPAASAQ